MLLKKKQLRSWIRSHVIKNTALELEPEPCLRKQGAPELEPESIHFYKRSAALDESNYDCIIVNFEIGFS